VLPGAAFTQLMPAARDEGPFPKKRVLMEWGGWEGHQPQQTVDIFAPWLVQC
jgi:hypothetical protein